MLGGLPNEVWIANILPNFDHKELAVMGLVSKKFYSLTRARSLWRHLDIEFVINKNIDEEGFTALVARY